MSINITDIYTKNSDYCNSLLKIKETCQYLNSTDSNNNNILHLSTLNKNKEIFMNALENAKLNMTSDQFQQFINHKNSDGNTPAHIGAKHQNDLFVSVLDDYGANLELRNNNNMRIINNEADTNTNPLITNNQVNQIMKNIMSKKNNSHFNVDEEFTNYVQQQTIQTGGAKKLTSISGSRRLKNFHNGGVSSESDSDVMNILNILKQVNTRNNPIRRQFNNNKTFERNSDEFHTQAIQKIMDMGYTKEDAEYLKSKIYYEVKQKNPNFKNYERSKQMLDMITEEYIQDLYRNIEQIKEDKRKAIEELNKKKKEKMDSKNSSNSSDSRFFRKTKDSNSSSISTSSDDSTPVKKTTKKAAPKKAAAKKSTAKKTKK